MHRVKDDFASAFDYIRASIFSQHLDQIEAILSNQVPPLPSLTRRKHPNGSLRLVLQYQCPAETLQPVEIQNFRLTIVQSHLI